MTLRRALLAAAALVLLAALAWWLLSQRTSDPGANHRVGGSSRTRAEASVGGAPPGQPAPPPPVQPRPRVTISGTVVERDTTPISSATVRAMELEGTREFAVRRTGADGRFEMPGLPLQDYRLYVHTGRHLPQYAGPIEFFYSGQRQDVLIRLEPGLTIEGRVFTSDGLPVAGAFVGSSDVGSGTVKADAEGRFQLGGLRPGELNLFATASGYASRHLRGVTAGSRDVVFTLEKPGSLLVPVRSTRQAGRVKASVCHRVSDAGEQLCVARQVYESVPARIELGRLASGDYELVIAVDDRTAYRAPVTVHPGRQVTLAPIELR
jgi:hypothetical protein